MKNPVIPATIWLLSATGSLAGTTDAISEFEAGLLCPPREIGEREAPDTASGTIRVIEQSIPITVLTTEVPAKLGIEFGIRAKLAPGMGSVDATVVITHPPYASNGITRESYGTVLSDGDWSLSAFRFDERYEILPGTWLMELWSNGRRLAWEEFQVKEDIPDLVSNLCEVPDLLS